MSLKKYLTIAGLTSLLMTAIVAGQSLYSSSQIIPPPTVYAWQGSLNRTWQKDWQVLRQGKWGMENITLIPDRTGRFKTVMRVRYPAGSASPAVTRLGAPSGGAQFLASLGQLPQEKMRLRYFLRFSPNFNFVKGGKLPGLYGGTANSGGNTPTGSDGFSARLMWRKQGDGEIYAYLPGSSDDYGTSLGRGSWRFHPGIWYEVEQELQLNTPGQSNGWVQIWIDQKPVFRAEQLNFRDVSSLKIDGLFFSTFFGGNDRSWATPKDVYIDFADFAIVNAIVNP
jgi:hypothetical protein